MNSKVSGEKHTTIQTTENVSELHTKGSEVEEPLIGKDATHQQEQEAGKKSNMWILLILLAGFFYALGNVAFGISCSQLGVYGAGFPAPISLVLVITYRGVEACKTKKRTGHFIDKANSNYWKVR